MHRSNPAVNRRSALGLLGLAAATPWIAGCGRDPEQAPTADPGTDATDQVSGTVRLAMAAPNPNFEQFMTEQMQALRQVHPDLEVELLFYPPPEYANAINLAFTSSNAPDVYRLTGPSPATNMVNSFRNGWLQPLTPFLTDEFRSRSFVEGTWDNPTISGLYVGDDVYGLPLESMPYTQVRILYCNTELLSDAGASGPPQTWGELADLAARMTDAGAGVYGFGLPGQNTVVAVDALQSTYGPAMTGIAPVNLVDGSPGASHESYLGVVDMLRDLNAQGLITPGWESWDAARPIQEFSLGSTGMYIGANFHAAQIRQNNPDLDFQMAAVPVPDAGRGGFSRVPSLNQPYWGMSSDARDPEAAWAVLDFMSTPAFQAAAYDALQLIPALTDALEETEIHPDTERILEIMEETQRIAPAVAMNGLDADQLLSAATGAAPSPNAEELYTSAITEGTDYEAEAQRFDERFDEVIDQTVERLQDEGLDVDRDSLRFPDWDPLEDYEG